MARQHVQRRQPVIHPRAPKPQPDDEGRRDMAQGFVEICAILLVDPVDATFGKRRARGRVEAVEIADHRLGHRAQRQRPARAAVGGNDS